MQSDWLFHAKMGCALKLLPRINASVLKSQQGKKVSDTVTSAWRFLGASHGSLAPYLGFCG